MAEVPPRVDRVFPLADAAGYPGNDFLDTVWFFPAEEGATYRIWMLTEAEAPAVEIEDVRFEPVKVIEGPPPTPPREQGLRRPGRWVDFGGGHDLFTEVSQTRPFAPMKFFGVTPEEARSSWLVVTAREDVELHGTIEDAERMLWGIARADAGTTRIHPSVVTVGEPAAFRMEYRLGDRALPPEARLRLMVPRAFAEPQADDPDAPGWIEIVESDAPLELESIGFPTESHAKRDVIYRLPEGLPAHRRVEVLYRTDFTYLFPCAFRDLDRRYWYSLMPVLAPAVSVDGKRAYVPPLEGAGHVVHHVAGPPERLFLFLPGRRTEDETLKLVGLVTDGYRNTPPSGQVHLPWRLVLEGEQAVELGTAAEHLVRAHRFEVPLPKLKPGVYRAKAVDPRTGGTVAVSNPLEVLPANSARPRIYWGEIHGHCVMSDGCGDYAGMYAHARDEGTLDFAASADHACYFSDNEWLRMQDITNGFNESGRFVTLVGYEWAGSQGHRNVYTSGDRLELFRGMCRRTSELNAVYDYFAGRTDVVAGPHTGHTGDFWAHHNPDVERFLEIYSMWGAFEHIAHENLSKGAVLGFTGGGDCHVGRCGLSPEDVARAGEVPLGLSVAIKDKCGLTAAVMPELSRPALVAALRDRRTYATTTARILLDFEVAGIPMGGRKATTGAVEVRTTVHACETIDRIEVIRGGEMVHKGEGKGKDQTFSWVDP
ncbi:MAG: hypothetical protein AMS16_07585, partial [Planctomycetes bacterium DG_58]